MRHILLLSSTPSRSVRCPKTTRTEKLAVEATPNSHHNPPGPYPHRQEIGPLPDLRVVRGELRASMVLCRAERRRPPFSGAVKGLRSEQSRLFPRRKQDFPPDKEPRAGRDHVRPLPCAPVGVCAICCLGLRDFYAHPRVRRPAKCLSFIWGRLLPWECLRRRTFTHSNAPKKPRHG